MDKSGMIKNLISGYTGHRYVWLTDCGDSAINIAVKSSGNQDSSVLIPDMGGWFSYRKIPKSLGMKTKEIKTDDGLIDKEKINVFLSGDVPLIIYANPAGYFANQDIQGIYSACSGKAKVIMDVSGSIGDSSLCDGKYADIMVGSFGKWKAVNAGGGGFISSKEDLKLSDSMDPLMLDAVYRNLLVVGERLEFLYRRCSSIKEDLCGHDIIHKGMKGLNVIVAYDDEEEKQQLLEYCIRNGLEYVLCPNYIKVDRKAISIEVKRLQN